MIHKKKKIKSLKELFRRRKTTKDKVNFINGLKSNTYIIDPKESLEVRINFRRKCLFPKMYEYIME